MRFLLVNTDYSLFTEQMYRREPELASASYERQLQARNDTFFGLGDAYARALRLRGHVAHDVNVNNAIMQAAWVRENGPAELARRFRSWRVRWRRGIVPWLDRGPGQPWLLDALAAQVEHHRPDVVLMRDIAWLPPDVLRRIVGRDTILIGQHAAPPYPQADYTPYDLIVSSWPPTIQRMRAAGVRTEHLALGFDPAVLQRLGEVQPDIPVSFVGSFTSIHLGRVEFVDTLCREVPGVQVFAPSVALTPKNSSIRDCYRGPAYGLDMYRVLARSAVTVNHHSFPEPHANNMRLFEATGVGALLLTDDKPDLGQYFSVGDEVLTYRTPDECISAIRDLSRVDRIAIAARGHRRTLDEHTWDRRIDKLLELLG